MCRTLGVEGSAPFDLVRRSVCPSARRPLAACSQAVVCRKSALCTYLMSWQWRLPPPGFKGTSWLELLIAFELTQGSFVCHGPCGVQELPLSLSPTVALLAKSFAGLVRGVIRESFGSDVLALFARSRQRGSRLMALALCTDVACTCVFPVWPPELALQVSKAILELRLDAKPCHATLLAQGSLALPVKALRLKRRPPWRDQMGDHRKCWCAHRACMDADPFFVSTCHLCSNFRFYCTSKPSSSGGAVRYAWCARCSKSIRLYLTKCVMCNLDTRSCACRLASGPEGARWVRGQVGLHRFWG